MERIKFFSAIQFFNTQETRILIDNLKPKMTNSYGRLYENLLNHIEKSKVSYWLLPIECKDKFFKYFASKISKTKIQTAKQFINDLIKMGFIDKEFFKLGIIIFIPFLKWNYGLFKTWQVNRKKYKRTAIRDGLVTIYNRQAANNLYKKDNPFYNFDNFYNELCKVYLSSGIDLKADIDKEAELNLTQWQQESIMIKKQESVNTVKPTESPFIHKATQEYTKQPKNSFSGIVDIINQLEKQGLNTFKNFNTNEIFDKTNKTKKVIKYSNLSERPYPNPFVNYAVYEYVAEKKLGT